MVQSVHTTTASLAINGAVLEVLSDSLTFDESQSPYIQGTLIVKTPANLNTIDPRGPVLIDVAMVGQYGDMAIVRDWSDVYRNRLVSALTADWGGKTVQEMGPQFLNYNAGYYFAPTILQARLTLRERTVNTDNTTLLVLASVEAPLHDIRVVDSPDFLNYGTLRSFINAVFTGMLTPANSMYQFALQPGPDDAPMPTGLNEVDPGGTWQPIPNGAVYWDLINTYVQQANLRLWADEQGLIRLTQRNFTVPGSVSVVAESTMIDASDTISRESDEWGDNIFMRWTGQGFFGQSWWPLVGGSPGKTMYLEYNVPPPFNESTPMDQRPAAKLYARTRTRGRKIPATAIADYTARPGMASIIGFPGAPLQTGLVESVAFQHPGNEMTVASRNLINA